MLPTFQQYVRSARRMQINPINKKVCQHCSTTAELMNLPAVSADKICLTLKAKGF